MFLRYLGEVATAVSDINGANRQKLYDQLLRVAKRKTAEADAQYDRLGKKVDPSEEEYGKNVLIVDQDPEELLTEHLNPDNPQQELF